MRFHRAPRPLVQLIAAILLTPTLTLALPEPNPKELAGFSYNELFERYDCAGPTCGYAGQYCCGSGQGCYTDTSNIAYCTDGAAAAEYTYWTTTITQTDLVTITSVMSSYIGGGAVATAASSGCTKPCGIRQDGGALCCAYDQYCANSGEQYGQCVPDSSGSSFSYYSSPVAGATVTAGATAGAPYRPTTSGETTITQTASPTTTLPFMSPVATGANITLTGSEQSGGGGLSGGAIAGIVIGVLIGLFLLGLLCFCCCLKGLLDGCLACFGLGKRRRRTEVEEYERHSHHSHGGGGRTWYGASRPAARVDRREKHHTGGNLLGVGAGLAALWAVLGLKRKRDRRHDEKYSEGSYSSDYYTSSSSASSDDRRTHGTRYSRR